MTVCNTKFVYQKIMLIKLNISTKVRVDQCLILTNIQRRIAN